MASTGTRPPREFNAFRDYEPSEAACIIMFVAFTVILFAHVWFAVRARIWWMTPIIVGALIEALGFASRYGTIMNRTDRTLAIVSQVFILISPAIIAANLYMLVGRAFSYVGRSYALISPNWITAIFVGVDLLSIVTQGGGGAVLTGGTDDIDRVRLGRSILLAGLFIQIIGFGVFLFVAVWFDYKSTVALRAQVAIIRPLMNVFYVSGGLILARSIFRLIEFMSFDLNNPQNRGYLFTTEWPIYVLDASAVALSVAIFIPWYPTKYIPATRNETLIKSDEVELQAGSQAALT